MLCEDDIDGDGDGDGDSDIDGDDDDGGYMNEQLFLVHSVIIKNIYNFYYNCSKSMK